MVYGREKELEKRKKRGKGLEEGEKERKGD